DGQALDLLEHGRMRRVERVAAVYLARNDDADGRRVALQRADLHRRRMGAQQHAVAQVERILRVERGVVLGEVEREKVVALGLGLRSDRAGEAQLTKDVADLVYDLRDEVEAAVPHGAPGHGQVQARRATRGALELALAGRKRGLEVALQRVRPRPDLLPGGRVELGQAPEYLGECAGLASEDLGLEILEPALVRLRNLLQTLPQIGEDRQEVARGQSACLATFASFMILFLRFRRATLLLTRGISRSLRHQQALEASFVGVRDQRCLTQVSLPLGMLLGQDMALVRVVAAQPASPGQPDAFAQCT